MKCLTLESKPGKQNADSKPIKKLSFCPFCLYHGSNDISYMNHIIGTHYNMAYGCNKCLKEVFLLGQQLKTHIKVCVGFPKDDTTSSSYWEPPLPGTQDSPHQISPHSKGAKSGSTKGPSSHKDHKKSHNIPRNGTAHQQGTSRMRTNPSLRNPTKSKSPPSVLHQIASMHAVCGMSSFQGLYSRLMHMHKAECLAI